MRTQLAIRIDSFLERYFPERRVFLRSDKDTRFIRLRPGVQLFAFLGAATVVAWSIIATRTTTTTAAPTTVPPPTTEPCLPIDLDGKLIESTTLLPGQTLPQAPNPAPSNDG